ncbi:hypothetical protein J6590_023322 [Homalodisca vitripennis]|nr:hypothetical protein J6590_023322 [Homalodisca vitripennis]
MVGNQQLFLNGTPAMVDNQQLFLNGTPAMVGNQQLFLNGTPAMVGNQQLFLNGSPAMVDNQQLFLNGSPAMVGNQQLFLNGSPAMVGNQQLFLNGMRALKHGRKNVHDEPRSDRPSVITEDLVNIADEKICEDQPFIISIGISNLSTLTLDEVKEAVKDWLPSQVADFYDIGIQKLVERYDKFLNKNRNYVEK